MVGPRQIWTGAENLAPTGIRSPDRPACSESLHRLSYPGLYKQILIGGEEGEEGEQEEEEGGEEEEKQNEKKEDE